MALREILLWPDERLSTRCTEVDEITPDLRTLVSDMFDTMYAAPGRGLAGPQVGAMLRLFVMDATWKEGEKTPFVAINPEITAPVTRPVRITLAWTDLDGVRHSRPMDGVEARIIQHEFDHLDGLVHFDRLDAKTRARLEEAYA